MNRRQKQRRDARRERNNAAPVRSIPQRSAARQRVTDRRTVTVTRSVPANPLDGIVHRAEAPAPTDRHASMKITREPERELAQPPKKERAVQRPETSRLEVEQLGKRPVCKPRPASNRSKGGNSASFKPWCN